MWPITWPTTEKGGLWWRLNDRQCPPAECSRHLRFRASEQCRRLQNMYFRSELNKINDVMVNLDAHKYTLVCVYCKLHYFQFRNVYLHNLYLVVAIVYMDPLRDPRSIIQLRWLYLSDSATDICSAQAQIIVSHKGLSGVNIYPKPTFVWYRCRLLLDSGLKQIQTFSCLLSICT